MTTDPLTHGTMNHETTNETPETDTQHAQFPMGGFTLDFARKLERERDQWVAKAAELSAERESNAMQALAYKAERDEARKLFESSKRARASLSEACDHLQRERDALHTQIATERLFALLPESSSQPEP